MKAKKKLGKLKVESFITSLTDEQKETVKGGDITQIYPTPCPTTWTSNCKGGATYYLC